MPSMPALNRISPRRPGLLLLAAAALAGCGSMPARDDLNGPPGATYQSSKSPTAYAQCLTPRWQATRVVGGVATVETVPAAGGGLRMTLKIAGGVGRVLEVVPQAGGSTIRYWNRSTDWGSGVPDSVQAILDCR